MKISEHISLSEAIDSPTAKRLKIDNTPSASILSNMQLVAITCFEPLRKWYGKPIKINSFYRCPQLNTAVGGSPTSQHAKGQAIDISAGSKEENEKLFNWLKDNVVFDQLINEYDFTWVHVSYTSLVNRKQVLVVK
jgi:zinc D-Ala-D-Ala carboxypeptidase